VTADDKGFLTPFRAFSRRRRPSAWNPSAVRTLQFIPSAVHRTPNDVPEGDDVTTSAGCATASYQEPAAAVRGDLIMPGDPGHDDEPQAEQPDTGRRRWAVLAVVSAAQFLITLDCGWSTSRSRRCSTTSPLHWIPAWLRSDRLLGHRPPPAARGKTCVKPSITPRASVARSGPRALRQRWSIDVARTARMFHRCR
jgi:hypothetical protein